MTWQPGDHVSLKGQVSETHLCVDCGSNTAPGFKPRAELEAIFTAQKCEGDGVGQSARPER
jgi:hypothetical protein